MSKLAETSNVVVCEQTGPRKKGFLSCELRHLSASSAVYVPFLAPGGLSWVNGPVRNNAGDPGSISVPLHRKWQPTQHLPRESRRTEDPSGLQSMEVL